MTPPRPPEAPAPPPPGRLAHVVDLVASLGWKSFRVRYARTRLGVVWAVLQAVALAATIAVVFERAFDVGRVEHFALYVLAGVVPFTFTFMAVSESTASIVANAGLVRKVRVPRSVYPAAAVVAVTLILLAAEAVVVVFAGGAGTLRWARLPALVAVVAICALTAFALGLAASAWYVSRRDVQFGIEAASRILFYASPIMYTPDRLPGWAQAVQRLNPVTGAMSLNRWVVLGRPLDVAAVVAALAVVAAALPVAAVLFRRRSDTFADLL